MRKILFVFALLLASILSAAVSREPQPGRIAEIEAALSIEPGDSLMRVGNRAVWGRLADVPDAAKVIARAERLLVEPVAVMTDEMYLKWYEKDRSLDTNAVPYYVPFWSRHGALGCLTVAEGLENSGRFVGKACDYFRAICAMRSWVMPSHDPGHRSFDGKEKKLDLGAAEMGVMVAQAHDCLREVLPEDVKELVAAALEEKIYDRYLGYIRGEMTPGWFYDGLNWTAVCHGCTARAALAALPDRHARAQIVEAAERGLCCYVDGFYSDGGCKEGMDYWNYGFRNFLLASLYVKRMTGGFVDFATSEQCERDFAFAFAGMLAPWKAPHFSDGAASPSPSVLALGQLIWPKYRTDRASATPVCSDNLDQVVAYAFDSRVLATLGQPSIVRPLVLPIRSHLKDSQMLYCRAYGSVSNGVYAVLKGGTNGEGHNHNDLGTYTVMYGTAEMAGDPGGAQYTKHTFTKQRYGNPIISSFGHPVPVIGGKLQSDGARFASKEVEISCTDACDRYVLDLTKAYDAPKLKSYERTMIYLRGLGEVEFRDVVMMNEPSTLEVPTITFCDVHLTGHKGECILTDVKSGRKMRCVFSATGGDWRLKVEKIPNPKRIEPTRLALAFDESVTQAVVSVRFLPL